MNVAYEQDFYSWTNNTEELEAMGKSQQHALVSRLAVLLMHLLKWQYQPEKCSRSWELTIIEQRHEIFELIEDSPSLKHTLEEAERETGIRYTKFPHSCPYTLEEVLDKQFYPEKSDV